MAMKRHTNHKSLRLAVLAAAIVVAVVAGNVALATVVGSKHDFSSGNPSAKWGTSNTDQICIFCHTPHNATTSNMLWNRDLPVANFTPYSSPTLNAAVGQPGEVSMMCLSCHDGSTAIDQFNRGRSWNPPTMPKIGDIYWPGNPMVDGMGPNIGGNFGGFSINDLSNDHPIGFVFDAALVAADPGLQLPAAGTLQLWSGRLECATCHEPHTTVNGPFLRMTNSQSQLCNTCHLK